MVSGATLVLAPAAATRDPEELASLLEREGADLMQATPSTWQLLIDSGWSGSDSLRAVCGGEAYGDALVDELSQRVHELWNFYGPTEATVWTTRIRLDADDPGPIPLGEPIPNMVCLVLDEYYRPVPNGVVGELFIGGLGLARGYFGRPDLTEERFVTIPEILPDEPRLYRTGDLVRRTGDGRLVFVGRSDQQVKLRGFRIELGEVESVLADSDGVSAAAVVLHGDPGAQQLVGYVVPAAPDIDLVDLKRRVSDHLPSYMMPTVLQTIDQLPRNAHGKLDRSALPDPIAIPLPSSGAPPSTPTERLVAALWSELLGTDGIYTEDDFFALGGHSLLAMKFAVRVRDRFDVDIPLDSLFTTPRLGEFAAIVDRASPLSAEGRTSQLPALKLADREEVRRRHGRLVFPATPAQARMWILEQLEPGRSIYNVPVARFLEGPLDADLLRQALQHLVETHEVFRTGLEESDGDLLQHVHEAGEVPLRIVRLPGASDDADVILQELLDTAYAPFELAEPPLLRALLITDVESGLFADLEALGVGMRLHDAPHREQRAGSTDLLGPGGEPGRGSVLCLTAHHSIIDGGSIEIVLDELDGWFRDRDLHTGPVRDRALGLEPRMDYGDFALWLQDPEMERLEEASLAYWVEELRGATTVLDFPFDHTRPPLQSHHGGRHFHRLPSDIARRVRLTASQRGATPFMVALAGWCGLLSRYCDQPDFLVGLPVSGRNASGLDRVVGLFVNTLPARISVEGDPNLDVLVTRARGRYRQHLPTNMSHSNASSTQWGLIMISPAILCSRYLPPCSPIFRVLRRSPGCPATDSPLTGAGLDSPTSAW